MRTWKRKLFLTYCAYVSQGAKNGDEDDDSIQFILWTEGSSYDTLFSVVLPGIFVCASRARRSTFNSCRRDFALVALGLRETGRISLERSRAATGRSEDVRGRILPGGRCFETPALDYCMNSMSVLGETVPRHRIGNCNPILEAVQYLSVGARGGTRPDDR